MSEPPRPSDAPPLWDRVRSALGGGGVGEPDRPGLRRGVVRGILGLRHRGRHGADELPRAVAVQITVGPGSIQVMRRLVDDPTFDEEIDAELRARLVGATAGLMPVRHYAIAAGPAFDVQVCEAADVPFACLRILDGDLASDAPVGFPADQAQLRLGRGTWHGDDQAILNDIVLTETVRYVSRRAGVLMRTGSTVSIAARDQGDCLLVRREGRRDARPSRTRDGRIALRPGDLVVFTDGAEQELRLLVLAPDAAAPDTEAPNATAPDAAAPERA